MFVLFINRFIPQESALSHLEQERATLAAQVDALNADLRAKDAEMQQARLSSRTDSERVKRFEEALRDRDARIVQLTQAANNRDEINQAHAEVGWKIQ